MLRLLRKLRGQPAAVLKSRAATPKPGDVGPAIDVRREAEAALKRLADAREDGEIVDRIAKSASLTADHAGAMHGIVKSLPLHEREPIFKALAALDRVPVDLLFKELGRAGDGNVGDDVADRVSAAAGAIVEKTGGALTAEQARAEIWKTTPGLYAEYRAQRRRERGWPIT